MSLSLRSAVAFRMARLRDFVMLLSLALLASVASGQSTCVTGSTSAIACNFGQPGNITKGAVRVGNICIRASFNWCALLIESSTACVYSITQHFPTALWEKCRLAAAPPA